MSDAVTALDGASFSGPVAQVEERPLQGMVTLRGDLSAPALAKAVKAATGCAMPGQRKIVAAGGNAVAWMSPDEVLLLVPHAEAPAVAAGLGAALAGVHHLAVDVSDARAMFRLAGSGVREVLARLCPADLSPAAFGPGELRRTRLAQVPAAFWLTAQEEARLVCFRSVARYAFDVLAGAAAGEPVGVFDAS